MDAHKMHFTPAAKMDDDDLMDEADASMIDDDDSTYHRLGQSLADTALSALQFLPMPVVVLSPFKTVVLANDAMSRLLQLPSDGPEAERLSPVGKTLPQIGVDVIDNGMPIWIDMDHFLDSIGKDLAHSADDSGDSTPTEPLPSARLTASNLDRTVVHDLAVEVAITPRRPLNSSNASLTSHHLANMIVSVWYSEGAKYFTLTFTSMTPKQAQQAPKRESPTTRSVTRATRRFKTSSSSSSDTASTISSLASHVPVFPPMGPPIPTQNARSDLHKISRLKDALLNSMNLPCHAVWKDESVGVPNRALLRLAMGADADVNCDQREFLARFKCYTEDFSRPLRVDEYPIVRILTTQQPVSGFRVGMKDSKGVPRVFDIHGETIRDECNNEFLGGYVILKDVTSYMDIIQQQQRDSKAQFDFIAQRIPQMVFTMNAQGIADWFSDRWYDYTGLTFEQSVDKEIGWDLLFEPRDKVAVLEAWGRAAASGQSFEMERQMRRRDGEKRWMLLRIVPLFDSNGSVMRWFGTYTDIDDSVKTRDTALQTRRQLRQVIETAQVTLWAVDLNRKITMMEGALSWQNASGDYFNVDEVMGQDIFDLIRASNSVRGREMKQYMAPIENILSGRSREEESQYCTNEGRSFRARYLPLIRNEGGRSRLDGCIGVLIDITELRTREDKLAMQEKENAKLTAKAIAAKEASRLKSSFLANMSHEIRTPIAGVIGLTELLLDSPLSPTQKDYADNIGRSANALLTVINDILDFSKVESGRLDIEEVQFCLHTLIKDLSKMLGFTAIRKNLSYVTDIGSEITKDLRLIGDPGRLRQIMTNLLTNSIKFTAEGFVKLSVKIKSQNADQVMLLFSVEDSGIGIEESARSRLFTPFCQADSSTARMYGGTGLGLTICKNLVELMHGEIEIDSAPGMGTTAQFWIPFRKAEFNTTPLEDAADASMQRCNGSISASLSTSEDSRIWKHVGSGGAFIGRSDSHGLSSETTVQDLQAVSVERLTPEERSSISVLIVEDNPVNQKIALKTVEKLHFPAAAVWNGQEAVEYLLKNHAQPPDIILMDCQMPKLDGYEATRMIRNGPAFRRFDHLRRIPIVAMTASAIRGDKEKCAKAGMDDYLAKPVTGKILEKMLVKWGLEGKRRGDSPRRQTMLDVILDDDYSENQNSSRTSSLSRVDTLDADMSQTTTSHIRDSEMLDTPMPAAIVNQVTSAQGEAAIILRDGKLLQAAYGVDAGMEMTLPLFKTTRQGSHAMTEENMAQFDASEAETG